jgi:metal-responsive CopG/Arc/MetJ family transcriptional regulator
MSIVGEELSRVTVSIKTKNLVKIDKMAEEEGRSRSNMVCQVIERVDNGK